MSNELLSSFITASTFKSFNFFFLFHAYFCLYFSDFNTGLATYHWIIFTPTEHDRNYSALEMSAWQQLWKTLNRKPKWEWETSARRRVKSTKRAVMARKRLSGSYLVVVKDAAPFWGHTFLTTFSDLYTEFNNLHYHYQYTQPQPTRLRKRLNLLFAAQPCFKNIKKRNCDVSVKKRNTFFNWTYLVGDHNQWILVLREKIKNAPESKSIPLWQNSATGFVRLVVFLCRKCPTQLIYVFLNKRALDNLKWKKKMQGLIQMKPTNTLLDYTALQCDKLKKACSCVPAPCPGCICWGKAYNPDWKPDHRRHLWSAPPKQLDRVGYSRLCTGCGTAPGKSRYFISSRHAQKKRFIFIFREVETFFRVACLKIIGFVH